MKILYATSIRFPSFLANRIQVISMARAFAEIFREDFFLSGNEIKADGGFQVANLGAKKSWKLAWRTLAFAKREKIGLIYCRETRLLFFIVLYNLFFFRLSLRFAYEIHGFLGRGREALLIDRFLAFFVSRYIFVTKALAEIYGRKHSIDSKRICVAPDGVDLEIFDIDVLTANARSQIGLSKELFVLGYFGQLKTLNMDKGVKDIIGALARLPENFFFLAAGGNEADKAEYQSLAKQKAVSNRTRFVGHVSQTELAVYQKACDVLLMPFPDRVHFAYYMSPLKMFEYMASERPIIATDLPSVREVLDEKSAVLVKPDNSEEIFRAVLELANNPEKRRSLALEARSRVNRYTWRQRVQEIAKFLAE